MAPQPRHRTGTRRAGVSVGGRFAAKQPPTIQHDVEFNTEPAVGPPNDWTSHTINLRDLSTTFTRTVNDDGSVSVTTDCEPADMMLLARKGDADYWTGATWSNDNESRRIWAADITARMLEEGLVATGYTNTGVASGIRATMFAASSSPAEKLFGGEPGPDSLTVVVAHIRGLRLIQSMAPADGWATSVRWFQHTARVGVVAVFLLA